MDPTACPSPSITSGRDWKDYSNGLPKIASYSRLKSKWRSRVYFSSDDDTQPEGRPLLKSRCCCCCCRCISDASTLARKSYESLKILPENKRKKEMSLSNGLFLSTRMRSVHRCCTLPGLLHRVSDSILATPKGTIIFKSVEARDKESLQWHSN